VCWLPFYVTCRSRYGRDSRSAHAQTSASNGRGHCSDRRPGVGSSAAQNGQEGGRTDRRGQNGDGVDSPYTATYRDTIGSVVLVTVSAPRGRGGLGSGFVIDDQHVVTNNHVVQSAAEGGVELQFSNEEWRTASIVGTDPYSDLAVLRVEELPDVASGLSIVDREPVIGQEVLVLGNPLGLDASISQGIVSGVDRVLPSPAGFDSGRDPDRCIGQPPQQRRPAGEPRGRGVRHRLRWSRPDDRVRDFPAPRESGHPCAHRETARTNTRSWASPSNPSDPTSRTRSDWRRPPASRHGSRPECARRRRVLQPAVPTQPGSGDVIVAIDGEEIQNQSQLLSYLALETSPGDTIELTVVRDGERGSVEVMLETRPEPRLPRTPIPGHRANDRRQARDRYRGADGWFQDGSVGFVEYAETQFTRRSDGRRR